MTNLDSIFKSRDITLLEATGGLSLGQGRKDKLQKLSFLALSFPGAMRETWVQSLGWEDPLEKGTATHPSILAWRIPWTV